MAYRTPPLLTPICDPVDRFGLGATNVAVNKVTHTSEGKAVEKVSSSSVSSISSSIDSERASSSERDDEDKSSSSDKVSSTSTTDDEETTSSANKTSSSVEDDTTQDDSQAQSSATRQSSSSSAKLTKLNVSRPNKMAYKIIRNQMITIQRRIIMRNRGKNVFSILGMINSYIGYFNMNATLKNRIYTVVGGVGNFYLLYVAYRFLRMVLSFVVCCLS